MSILLKHMHLSFENTAIAFSVLAISAGSTLFIADAQEPENVQSSAPWEKISQVDARISASRTSWDAVFSTPTGPTMSKQQVDQQVKWAEEKARQAGESEANVKQVGQVARKTLEGRGKRFSTHTQLNFVRVGNIIRSEINFVEAKTRAVEMYDGRNSVFVETMVNGVEYPPRGYLRREVNEILSHSAPTWQTARFLTGIPLAQELSPLNPAFSPKDTILREGEGNTLILEKRTNPIAGKVGIEFSALLRITLSKEHLRPLSYEMINLLNKGEEKGKSGRVDVSGYKRYANAIWFPSKIVVTTPAFRDEYNLIKAEFNESVDPLELRLPPNTSIADSRFGPSVRAIRYKPKNGEIPTDNEVRKMLGLKEEKDQVTEQAENQQETGGQKQVVSMSFAPGLGLLCLAFGVFLWTRAKKPY